MPNTPQQCAVGYNFVAKLSEKCIMTTCEKC